MKSPNLLTELRPLPCSPSNPPVFSRIPSREILGPPATHTSIRIPYHRENAGGPLGWWYPSCLTPLLEVYMGLTIKRPPSQGYHHIPYDHKKYGKHMGSKLPWRNPYLQPKKTPTNTLEHTPNPQLPNLGMFFPPEN